MSAQAQRIGASEMLRRLGSGVRPPGVDAPARVGVDGLSFQNLLERARSVDAPGGRPLTLRHDVALDETQRAALTRAADEATRRGASRLFAVVDGGAHVVDLEARVVARSAGGDAQEASGAAQVLTGVDAGVHLLTRANATERADNDEDVEAAPGVLGTRPRGPPPSSTPTNPSLIEALSGPGDEPGGGRADAATRPG